MTSPNGSPKQLGKEIAVMKKTRYKKVCKFGLEVTVPIWGFYQNSVSVSQYAPQKMSANASPCHPTHFLVDILFLLLYSIIYKGLRGFVLVLWMQRQCPVTGCTSLLYANSLTSCGHATKLHLKKSWVLLALAQISLMCVLFQIVSSYTKILDYLNVILSL